ILPEANPATAIHLSRNLSSAFSGLLSLSEGANLKPRSVAFATRSLPRSLSPRQFRTRRLVEKLTRACTSCSLFKVDSIRHAQEAQCIPSTARLRVFFFSFSSVCIKLLKSTFCACIYYLLLLPG